MAPRFNIVARDVPPKEAAKRLGKSLEDFNVALPNLIARGFPLPDPDTGNYDLVAIDKWCDARQPHLFGSSESMQARDAGTGTVVKDRIASLRASRR